MDDGRIVTHSAEPPEPPESLPDRANMRAVLLYNSRLDAGSRVFQGFSGRSGCDDDETPAAI